MNPSENQKTSIFTQEDPQQIVLTKNSILKLKTTTKWAKFLAIVGFVFVGLMILLGVFMLFILPEINQDMPQAFSSRLISIFYFVAAALYFFPALYLFHFANKTQKALLEFDKNVLEDALNNLSKHFKFIGIMLLVMLALYALALIGGIVGGLTTYI